MLARIDPLAASPLVGSACTESVHAASSQERATRSPPLGCHRRSTACANSAGGDGWRLAPAGAANGMGRFLEREPAAWSLLPCSGAPLYDEPTARLSEGQQLGFPPSSVQRRRSATHR